FHFMLPPPPRSTLFPYTTLFRSVDRSSHRPLHNPDGGFGRGDCGRRRGEVMKHAAHARAWPSALVCALAVLVAGCGYGSEKTSRSEEHTSELQSRGHLVCRLLLE